jgi:hypothetical protein
MTIQEMQQELTSLRARLTRYRSESISADDVDTPGVLDDTELARIHSYDQEIATLDARIRQMISRQPQTTEHNVIQGEEIVVTARQRPYTDEIFKTAFIESIRTWGNSAQNALNAVQGYHNSGSEDNSQFSAADFFAVMSLALSSHPGATAAISVIALSVDLIKKGIESQMPAQPSISQLHNLWFNGISNYVRGSHDNEFEQFIILYKRENQITSDVDLTVEDLFLSACRDFVQRLAPQGFIQRQFVSRLLAGIQDTMDWGSEAGFADIDMTGIFANQNASVFSFNSGQIDDIGAQLMNAVTTVWANSRVIDLPIPIVFNIYNVNRGNKTVVKRSSRTPGSTAFVFVEGDSIISEAFIRTHAYNNVRVNQLTYDS